MGIGEKDTQEKMKVEYKVVSERNWNEKSSSPIKYTFYENGSKTDETSHLDHLEFPEDTGFLMTMAKKQRDILNKNKIIKSIESTLIV
ncbi:MAG: hypothetical protein NTU63_00450 [Candidatus Pacearchaeota archaeon]|nr:hypothetical protein [Candidatus Pacearchaeota archaeon]